MNGPPRSTPAAGEQGESQRSAERTRWRQVVRFTDVGEFIAELARDAELIERRIVRLTQEARAVEGGALHYLLVHAGAVIEGQLVCLTAYAGQQWGEGMQETKRAYERADELTNRIRTACEAAGLETRPGAFQEQLR